MPQQKVFISYSHVNKKYREELRRVLETVPSIDEVLWFDEKAMDIGDKFHPTILQAMNDSGIGILLLSTDFFLSHYIKQHELPYLLRRAEQGTLQLACLYITAIPDGAFPRTVEVDGQPRTVSIKEYIGANSPGQPLDSLWRKNQRHKVYVELANWVAQQIAARPAVPPQTSPLPTASNVPPRPGERFELTLSLQNHGGQWHHSFSLPRVVRLDHPPLTCPAPQQLFSDRSLVEGDQLFQLLFGKERASSGAILGAAFHLPTADPTRYPLRLHLCTSDARLYALPWNNISYQNRRLVEDGWSVELHPDHPGGFPEYPAHTCYFPGKVVLIQAAEGEPAPQAVAHQRDLQNFFQRHWQEAPEPLLVHTVAELHEALHAGATRLVYIYGTASSSGLPLAGTLLPWDDLAALLQRSQSVSAVFVNLLGEASFDATPATRVLLTGTKAAVLVQCHERSATAEAARAGLAWLNSVFVSPERLDPVVALHQHARGQAIAWTRYTHWQTVAPHRVSMPELVHLLLDRRSQRAELAQAKLDFYDFKMRRIYQAVAFGLQGARVKDFPDMVSQHLRQGRRPQEVFRNRAITLQGKLEDAQDIDDLVRQQYNLGPRDSVLGALLDHSPLSGTDFWFIIVGWKLTQPLADARHGTEIIQAIATWCRTHLLQAMQQEVQYTNVRVLSVVAMEAASEEIAEDLEDAIPMLIEELNDDASFHLGTLAPLAKVERHDLRTYFQDPQICSCPEPYRREFPGLLLGGRRDMPFGEAVTTIKRGEPDDWHTLFEELQAMTARGEWPPQEGDETFWEARDGR